MKLGLLRRGAPWGLATLFLGSAAQAVTSVCVDVEIKEWKKVRSAPSAGGGAPGGGIERDGTEKSASSGAGFGGERSSAPSPRLAKDEPLPAPAASTAFGWSGGEPQGDEPSPDDASLKPAADDAASVQGGEPSVMGTRPVEKPKEPQPAIDPALYLKRMLEYEITHEPEHAAVAKGCQQRLTVELYALDEGWTVFARYTQNQREEKVDRVQLDEFVPLAQRIARALLYDLPITETITRENVLRADSSTHLRSVSGRGHFVVGMGTMLRVGELPTATRSDEPAQNQLRLLTPLGLQLGSRYKLRSWGLDAFARLNLGTQSVTMRENPEGGHVDYSWGLQAGLRFLRYADAAGISSFYYGGGADFELAIFRGITRNEGFGASRRALTGGGLNLTGLVGYEFLRSSAAHFFVQAELQLPSYVLDVANDAAKLNTWLPGAFAQVGVAL